MAEIDITQAEADALIAIEKHCLEDKMWLFPQSGGRLSVELFSPDRRENFMLDITRAQIKLTKATYQNVRGRSSSLCALISRAHRIGIRTIRKSHARICTYIVKASAINGRLLRRWTGIRTRKICFPPSRRSCDIAMSPRPRTSRRGCSHECSLYRDRKAPERLPELA